MFRWTTPLTLIATLSGCTETDELDWRFVIGASDMDDTAQIEALIFEGNCPSTPEAALALNPTCTNCFSTVLIPTGAGSFASMDAPRELPEGPFSVLGQSTAVRGCTFVAWGCVTVELPLDGDAVVVPLDRSPCESPPCRDSLRCSAAEECCETGNFCVPTCEGSLGCRIRDLNDSCDCIDIEAAEICDGDCRSCNLVTGACDSAENGRSCTSPNTCDVYECNDGSCGRVDTACPAGCAPGGMTCICNTPADCESLSPTPAGSCVYNDACDGVGTEQVFAWTCDDTTNRCIVDTTTPTEGPDPCPTERDDPEYTRTGQPCGDPATVPPPMACMAAYRLDDCATQVEAPNSLHCRDNECLPFLCQPRESRDGMPCRDEDPCTIEEVCSGERCVGVDPCEVPSTCDPRPGGEYECLL